MKAIRACLFVYLCRVTAMMTRIVETEPISTSSSASSFFGGSGHR